MANNQIHRNHIAKIQILIVDAALGSVEIR